MNILIISPYKKFTSSCVFISPLIFWEKNLRRDNIFIKITDSLKNLSFQDIIILDSKFIKVFKNDLVRFKNESLYLKGKCNKLILADNTDSCDWLLGDLIDYFDFVWKGQLYKDRSIYKKKHYGGRIFTDEINERYGIKDSTLLYNYELDNSQIDKLKISWNSGLIKYIDYRFLWKFKLFHNQFFRGKLKPEINHYKNNSISARFNLDYNRNTVKFTRETAKKFVEAIANTNRINISKYFQELYRSKICISPFGWGEICYRDFECFQAKSILLKNDISHLETWPKYYQKNITYIPLKLDSSDHLIKINEILDNYESFNHIALNGYKKFEKYTSVNFGTNFSCKIKELINIYADN